MPRVWVPVLSPQSARIEPVPLSLLSLRNWPLQPWVMMNDPQEVPSPVSSAKEPVWVVVPTSEAAPPPPPSASQLPASDPTAGMVAPRRASVPVKVMLVTPLAPLVAFPLVDQFLVPVLLRVTLPDPAKVAPVPVLP